eukprot:COSAG01_NODE_4351_length_5111_cov_2.539689_6_plen_116_part_00
MTARTCRRRGHRLADRFLLLIGAGTEKGHHDNHHPACLSRQRQVHPTPHPQSPCVCPTTKQAAPSEAHWGTVLAIPQRRSAAVWVHGASMCGGTSAKEVLLTTAASFGGGVVAQA